MTEIVCAVSRRRGGDLKTMNLTRQHAETELPELYGQPCQKLQVIRSKDAPCRVSIFYLRASDVWHRFYLDAGLLFWSEGSPPTHDDDLLDGEERVEMGDAWGLTGYDIEHVSFGGEGLLFRCSNGRGFRAVADTLDGDPICQRLEVGLS